MFSPRVHAVFVVEGTVRTTFRVAFSRFRRVSMPFLSWKGLSERREHHVAFSRFRRVSMPFLSWKGLSERREHNGFRVALRLLQCFGLSAQEQGCELVHCASCFQRLSLYSLLTFL